MESESSGYIKQAMERLLMQVEELKRRQEASEVMMQRIMAEVELCRRQQDALKLEWQDFGRGLRTYSAAWEARLQSQLQQLEAFARQLGNFTKQFAALLPSEEE